MLITDELTNKVCFSQRITWYNCWKDIENALTENGIAYALLPNTNDIWVRDFMPVQTDTDRFVGYSYNPDYLIKDPHLRTNDATKCYDFNKSVYQYLDLKIDGGNVIKCDDKVIMTEKVFEENSSLSEDTVIGLIKDALHVKDVVIIPWDREEDYGHADGMVRYVSPGHVLINQYADIDMPLRTRVISALTPYFSNISELCYGKNSRADSWAHLNFLRIRNIIFVPTLNIPSDGMAVEQLGNIYKDCKIIPVLADDIVRREGALNCISWNIRE